MHNWIKILGCALLILMSPGASAQFYPFEIYSQVYHGDKEPLTNAFVYVVNDENDTLLSDRVDSLGKVGHRLAFGNNFWVHYSAEGYVTKFIQLDLRNVPLQEQRDGGGMDVSVTLFKADSNISYALLLSPVAIGKYDPRQKAITFDKKYFKEFNRKMRQYHPELLNMK